MTARDTAQKKTLTNYEKRRGERDGGGHPQHFLKLAAEAQGRGARAKVPASKFSPATEIKKSRSRTSTSHAEESDSEADSESEADSDEAVDAAKSLITLNSSSKKTEKNRNGDKGEGDQIVQRAFYVEVKLAERPPPQRAPKLSVDLPSVSFDIFADMPLKAQVLDDSDDDEIDDAISFESQLANKLFFARARLGIDLTEERENLNLTFCIEYFL